MSNSSDAFPILNPFTPLVYLPPDIATQLDVTRYIFAATLGGCIWDIFINLNNDYRLLFKQRVRLPTIAYFGSRIFTTLYVMNSFIFQVAPIANCQALQIALGICYSLSQSLTAFLFFLRVTAVWLHHKVLYWVFFFLWICIVGCSITIPVGIQGAHIGPTRYCVNTAVAPYTEASIIMGLINDSIIFIAITYRILSYTMVEEGYKAQVNAFIKGDRLSRLSYTLLQGGQQFYAIALFGNILAMIMLKVPGLAADYRGMVTIPVLALVNAMACIVFRNIRFGLTAPNGTTIQASTTALNTFHAGKNIHITPTVNGRGNTNVSATTMANTAHSLPYGQDKMTLDHNADIPLSVRVNKETVSDIEYGHNEQSD